MDQATAIALSRDYLRKVRENAVNFSEAWLFGSFARAGNHENSDIDIAIVLPENNKSFDMEVKLMVIRTGEETMIEPHVFNKEDFENDRPIIKDIIKDGLQITI